MANTVKTTFSADDREIIKSMLKQQKEITKIQQKLLGAGRAGGRAGKQTNSEFGKATSTLKSFVGVIAGVGSVVAGVAAVAAQVRREIENIRNRQRKASDTQLQVAAAQREALFNFEPDKTLTQKQLSPEIARISEKTGARQTDLFQAFSTGASFKGAKLTNRDALEALEVSAEISPGDQGAIVAQTQAILAQQKRTGGTARQIAGQQLAVKRVSPVASGEAFATNIAPGIADLAGFGDTPRQAGAILATLGQGANDPEGRVTRTGAINFAKQLQILLPDVEGGTIGRLKVLQSKEGEKIRKRLLGPLEKEAKNKESVGLKSEAKLFTTLVNLLQGGDLFDLLEKNLDKIPSLDQSSKVLEKKLLSVNRERLQLQANIDRAFGASAQQLSLVDLSGGLAEVSRKGLTEVLERSGVSDIEKQLTLFGFEQAGGGLSEKAPLSTVTRLVRKRGEKLAAGLPGQNIPSSVPGGSPTHVPGRPATKQELQQSRALLDLADKLDRFIDQLEAKPEKAEAVKLPKPQIQALQPTGIELERTSTPQPKPVAEQRTAQPLQHVVPQRERSQPAAGIRDEVGNALIEGQQKANRIAEQQNRIAGESLKALQTISTRVPTKPQVTKPRRTKALSRSDR